MKKFKFSLQALLDVRTREEKSAKSELFTARAELFQLQKQLEELINYKELCENDLRENAKVKITVEQMRNFYDHLNKLNDNIESQKSKIKNAEKKCEKIMQRLIEFRKTIKMLDTLKEQKYQEYLNENEKEEMKILDDFINSRGIVK